MRIIAGKKKGIKIFSPLGTITRPSSNRIRETIMGVLEGGRYGDPLNSKLILDLFSGVGSFGLECISRGAGKVTFIETGISIQLPAGCGGFILPRSGLASKYSITSINSPGLIDPGYTGEIKVPLINHSDEVYNMKINERFAQLVLINVNDVEFKIVKKLDESIRSD